MEPTGRPPADPPPDPDDWTDEEWLEWLAATEEGTHEAKRAAPAHRRPRQRGGLMGAAMLGVRDAIYGGPEEQVTVVVDASGDPPRDDHLELHLDPEHPEASEVVIRPRRKRQEVTGE